MLRKVFGIISYFPDNDTEYHKHIRRLRMRRCSELLLKLSSLWADIDIIIIAQNWQDYKPPITVSNHGIIYKYDKLGILQARKTLREKFLESDYDYLIMLDDDAVIECSDPSIYIDEIDKHPDSVGVIRHNNNPLMFMAISKSVYKEINFPDINIENGEGFSNIIFAEKCFAQSDKAFDFPKGCVKELSHKHKYSELCPSTWLSENSFDWSYMSYITEAYIQLAKHKRLPCTSDKNVDIVIPYVDSSDPVWQKSCLDAGNSDITSNRFRSWDTLKYLLRGVEKYMPFVRNVILIVSDENQVPKWLNTKEVRVVYHRDFIPEEFLPTFNSCTIEAFLFNITKLSEQFIYFNDDIFPINGMVASDFFVDSKPLLRFQEHQNCIKQAVFSLQCRNSLDLITQMLHLDNYDEGELITPDHSAMPMLKSSVDEVGLQCIEALKQSISQFREDKNINQYIYHYYHYFQKDYVEDCCPYLYLEINNNLNHIRYIILNNREIPLLCLNDMDTVSNYKETQQELISIFELKFPDNSKYEN